MTSTETSESYTTAEILCESIRVEDGPVKFDEDKGTVYLRSYPQSKGWTVSCYTLPRGFSKQFTLPVNATVLEIVLAKFALVAQARLHLEKNHGDDDTKRKLRELLRSALDVVKEGA